MTKKKKKSTNSEIIQRVNTTVNMILDGSERFEICQYAADEWNVSSRQTYRYIKAADLRIQRQARRDDNEMFYRVKRRLQRQYRRAIEREDWALARLLLKDMRELYGFDKPRKAPLDPEGKSVKPEFNLIINAARKIEPEKRRTILELLNDD